MKKHKRNGKNSKEKKVTFEKLEDRVYFSATPVVDVEMVQAEPETDTDAFVNEDFEFKVTFDNEGQDIGYGPFLDVFFEDGLDTSGLSASLLGENINLTFINYDGSGVPDNTEHPLTSMAIGTDSNRANGTLVIAELPYGSFSPDQPLVEVIFSGTAVENDADLYDEKLEVEVVGGFHLGETPEDDAGSDPAIISSDEKFYFKPHVYSLTKTTSLPENEVVSGPNNEFDYILTVNIADGQTLDDLVLEDKLHDGFIITGITISGSNGYSSIELDGNPLTIPLGSQIGPFDNEELIIDFDDEVGTDASDDIVVRITGYISEFEENGYEVIDDKYGTAEKLTNEAKAIVKYDGENIGYEKDSVDIFARSLAVQKGVEVLDEYGNPKEYPAAGDILKYTIDFQISDFFEFKNLKVYDLLSDGQDFLTSGAFKSTLTVVEEGTTRLSNNTFNSSNIYVSNTGSGGQQIKFKISDELQSEGKGSALEGDFYDDNNNTGATYGQIVYYTKIREFFRDAPPSNDSSVDIGDWINNDACIYGQMTKSCKWVSDISPQTMVEIGNLDIEKTVFAVNSVEPEDNVVGEGDVVTFKISIDMSTADVEDLRLHDYLPSPLFDVSEITGGSINPTQTAPGFGTLNAGDVRIVMSSTVENVLNNNPVLSVDNNDNSFDINFGEIDVVNSGAETIDIYFAVTVQESEAFADKVVNNDAVVTYENSKNEKFQKRDLAPVIYEDEVEIPLLNVDKSIVATSESHTTFVSGEEQLAIGEIVRYRMVVEIPELKIPEFTIKDVLPSGLQYIDGTAKIAFVANGTGMTSAEFGVAPNVIGNEATLGSITPSTLMTDASVSSQYGSDVDTYGSGTDIFFKLGELKNKDNDADKEFVVIEFNALVLNTNDNKADGTTSQEQKDNKFIVATGDPNDLLNQRGTSNIVDGRIVEPDVNLIKRITQYPNAADAGGTVMYEIEITNANDANTATAFNLFISDLLDDDLDLTSTSITVNTGGSSVIISETQGVPQDKVEVTIDQLGAGETIKIQIAATLNADVEANEEIANKAFLDYSSLPGSGTQNNPTGSNTPGGFNDPDGERGYWDMSENVIFLVNAPTIDKLDPVPAEYTIGDVVNYTIEVTLPEGSIPELVLTDVLDFGLSFVSSAVSITPSSGDVTTNLAGGFAAITNGVLSNNDRTLTVDLGDVLNSNSNDGVPEKLTITYQAIVTNDIDQNNVPDSISGDMLFNEALIEWGGAGEGDDSDKEKITILEPELKLTKTLIGDDDGDAGDVFVFEIKVEHTGNSETTAYDVVVEDIIPEGLDYLGNLTLVNGQLPNVDIGGLPTVIFTWDELTLAQGENIFRFEVKISDEVVSNTPDQVNSAKLTYDTQDEDDADEEREYEDEDTASPIDIKLVYDMDKDVIDTSHDHTGDNQFDPTLTDLAIGETVTFELIATFAEGTTLDVIIKDQLPAINGILDITKMEVMHIGANLTSENNILVGDLGTLQDLKHADGYNDTAFVNFGDVVNIGSNREAPNDDDRIKIYVTALVVDVAENQAGDTIKNKGNFWKKFGDKVDYEYIELVEPELNIEKSVIGATEVQIGDTITYQINIEHTGDSTADAFDLKIEDLLPDGLDFVDGSLVLINGVLPTVTDNTEPSIVFEFDELALGGGPLTFQFNVLVTDQITTNELVNPAELTYDSLPEDDDPNERDYEDEDEAGPVIVTFDDKIEKHVINTSEDHTDKDEHDTTLDDLAVGEEVEYEVIVTFNEGYSTGVKIQDFIPIIDGKLEILNAEVTFIGGNLNTTLNVGDLATLSDNYGSDGIIDYAVFNVGTVNNTGTDGIPSDADRVKIKVKARLVDVPENQDGDVITNNAELWTNESGDLVAQAHIEVVEPELKITKTLVNQDNEGDAGDVFTFEIKVEHTGASTADAFDVVVSDLIPEDLVFLGNLQLVQGDLPAIDTIDLPVVRFTWDAIEKEADAFIFRFDVKIADTVTSVTPDIINVAELDYDSLPEDDSPYERDYEDEDEAGPIDVKLVYNMDKEVIDTSHDHTNSSEFDTNLTDLAIGETVTFELTATFAEGTTLDVIIKDILPSVNGKLDIQNMIVTHIGANLTIQNPIIVGSTGTLQDNFHGDGIFDTGIVDFGDIVNAGSNGGTPNDDDRIKITVTALVVDVAQNQAGDVIKNKGVLWKKYGDKVDNAYVELVEPELDIEKSIIGTTTGGVGDTITYQVSIDHTANSTADAFDLVIEDLIPTGLEYAGNLVLVNGILPTVDDSGDPTILFAFDELAQGNGPLVFQFDVMITADAEPGDELINGADLTYDSLPEDDDPNERDYEDDDDAGPVVITFDDKIEKHLISTSQDHTEKDEHDTTIDDLTVGEEAEFEIIATFGEGNTTNVKISDFIPTTNGVLEILEAEVTFIGANLNTTLNVGDLAALFDIYNANGGFGTDGVNDLAEFNIGNVFNAGTDGIPSDADRIKIVVKTRLIDVIENQDGDLITNNATLWRTEGGDITDTSSIEVVEPDLKITKTLIGDDTGDAGDIFTFELKIEHTGLSTADAFDLMITDLLPAELEYVGNVQLVTGVLPTIDDSNAPLIKFSYDSLEKDAVANVFTFDVKLKDTVTVLTADQINSAELTYDSLPEDDDQYERDYEDEDEAAPILVNLDYDLTKDIVETSHPHTEDEQFNPLLEDLTIGETVTYEIVATFGEGTTNNVFIADIAAITNGILDIESAEITFIGGNLTNSMTLTVGDLGQLIDNNTDTFNEIALFNFGTVTNTGENSLLPSDNDRIKIKVVARVKDVIENQAGDVIENFGFLAAQGITTIQDNADIEIVEPELNITKSIVGNNVGLAGDTFTFQIDIAHTLTSTADAFDLMMEDLLPAGLEYAGNLQVLNGPAPVIDDSGDPLIKFSYDELALGDGPLSFTFDVKLAADVEPGIDDIINGIDLTYDSLPEDDDLEERDYEDDDEAGPIHVTFQDSIVKSIIDTNQDHTELEQYNEQVTDLAIGEEVDYEIVVTFSEGLSTNVTIGDLLPTTNGVLEILGAEISHIGTNLTTSLNVGDLAQLFDVFNANGASGTDGVIDLALFSVGNVLNSGNDGISSIDDQIKITLKARLVNVPQNENGDVITNEAIIWSAESGEIKHTVDIEVVEPQLNVTKSLIGDNTGDAGDIFTFEISIDHLPASTADAFDLVISDIIPSELQYLGNLTLVNGVLPTVDASGDPTIEFSWDSLALEDGPLTFRFEVALKDSVTILTPDQINVANLSYDSLPEDEDPNERDYDDSDEAAPIIVNLNYDIDKNIVDTSHPHTEDEQFNPDLVDLAIGETVTFEIIATFAEGTTNNVLIADSLALLNGILDINSATIDSIGANLTNSNGLVNGDLGQLLDTNTDTFFNVALFDFGTVVNTGSNGGTPNSDDQIRILVTATVVNIPANQAGDEVQNFGVLIGQGLQPITDTESIEIVEPELDITKTLIGPSSGDAGDIFTFEISIDHLPGSTADAFDLLINDILDSGLEYVGNLQVINGPAPSVNIVNNSNVEFSYDSLALGDGPLTFRIDVKLADSITVLTPTQFNTAELTYDTLPEDNDPNEREYEDEDKAGPITVNMDYDFEKTIVDTSHPHTEDEQFNTDITDLAIGETVTFELTATFAEGTTIEALIKDALFTNNGILEITNAEISFIGSNLTIGSGLIVGDTGTLFDAQFVDGINDTVLFDLGDVINTGSNGGTPNDNDRIKILVTALVRDVPANIAGDQITNIGVLEGRDIDDVEDTADVELVEPELNITKTLIGPNSGDAGDIFTFEISIDHLPASTADAFDLIIKDILTSDLEYVGNLIATSGPAPTINIINNQNVEFSFDSLNLGDGPLTFTFEVKLADTITSITPAQFNTAELTYDSLPEDNDPNERDYDDEDQSEVITVNMEYDFEKNIVDTSHPHTEDEQFNPALDDLAIGETVTFELLATFAEGTTVNVAIIDSLVLTNGILNIDSAVIDSIGTNLTNSNGLVVGDSGTVTDTNTDTFFNLAVFDFGTIVNTGSNGGTPNSDDQIRILVTATLVDIPANQAGDEIENFGVLVGNNITALVESEKVEVVEPELNITKTLTSANTSGDAGDVFTFEISIDHTANSTADAFDLVIEDLIPSGLQFAGNLQVINGPAPSVDNSGDPLFKFSYDSLDLGAGPLTFTFDVTIADSVTILTPDQINVANLSYDSLPDDNDPNERDYTDSDEAGPIDIIMNYDVEKSIFSTSNSDTNAEQFDDLLTDLSIGETVTFELSATFAEGTTNNVFIIDSLPTVNGILNITNAQISAIGSNLTNSMGLTVGDFGSITDLNFDTFFDTATFDFGTVVNSGENNLAPSDNDRIKILITAVVVNQPENVASDVIENQVDLKFTEQQTDFLFEDNVFVELVEPELVIDKEANNEFPEMGEVVTYTLTIDHLPSSSATAHDLIINDVLPSGLTLNTGSITVNGANIINNNSNTTSLQLVLDKLDLGDSITITYDVIVGSSFQLGDTITNLAELDWDSHPDDVPEERDGEDEDDEIITVVGPDLLVQKFTESQIVEPGQSIEYFVSVTNKGGPFSTTAFNVTLTDLLPPELTYVSSTNDGSISDPTVVGQNLVWNIPSLGSGDTITFSIIALVNNPVPAGSDLLCNEAIAVLGEQVEPTPEDNEDTAKTELIAQPDYNITITDNLTTVAPGDPVTYVIVVRNDGNQDGTNVEIVQSFPPALIENLSPNLGGVVDTFANTVTWTFASFPVGNEVTLLVNANVLASAVDGDIILNEVTVQDDGTNGADPTPLNNFDDDITAVVVVPTFTFSGFNNLNAVAFTPDTPVTLSPFVPTIPLYSGSASPGSTLVIEIRDAFGRLIASQSTLSDAGGNWLVAFPLNSLFDNFAQIVVSQVQSSQADDVNNQAFTFFYAPVNDGALFTSEQITSGGAIQGSASSAIEALYKAALNPISDDWDQASYDYFGAQGSSPSGY